MRPFTLEEYMKNPDCPIVTNFYCPVRIVSINNIDPDYPVVGLVELFNSGKETVLYFSPEGRSAENNTQCICFQA